MKTPLKFALLAVGLSAMMSFPASAQQFKSRGKGCDNVSTSRDKTPKPDSRCLQAPPESYAEQQARVFTFIHANPPTKTTIHNDGVRYQGTDSNGKPYEIFTSPSVSAGWGSANKLGQWWGGSNGRWWGSSSGSRGGTKPR